MRLLEREIDLDDLALRGAAAQSTADIGKMCEQLLALRLAPRESPGPRLVSARDTRKRAGSFYTDARLAAATVRRTIAPLCFGPSGAPRSPEEILDLRICDPACGCGVFLVEALHFLTDALRPSLNLPEAVLKRRVAERCLFGVDLDPLAAELARITLWLEVGDDAASPAEVGRNIRTGNAIVGAWRDGVGTCPVDAWKRLPPGPERRRTLTEVRQLAVEETHRARLALNDERSELDTWCALWFWPRTDSLLPTPATLDDNSEETSATASQVARTQRFFHWELEFPKVFSGERWGFDAVIGNPPWDVLKHSADDDQFDDSSKENSRRQHFADLSNWFRNVAATQPADRPFRRQGGTDPNAYKLFLEQAWHLLRRVPRGDRASRLGMIVPSGLYSDRETLALRRMFLEEGTWEWLFSFENRRRIFDIDSSIKFCVAIAERGSATRPLRAAFLQHDVAAWERDDPPAAELDPAQITLLSPRTRSIPEIRSSRDLELIQRICARSHRIGDRAPGWEFTYVREFDQTLDAKAERFQPLSRWEALGHVPDAFGRWVQRDALEARGWSLDRDVIARPNPEGAKPLPEASLALPLLQGSMIWQFDPAYQTHRSGQGRSARWEPVPHDRKRFQPALLMAAAVFRAHGRGANPARLAFRDGAKTINERTMIASLIPPFPANNKVPLLLLDSGDLVRALFAEAVLNSFVFDFVIRTRMAARSLNWHIVEECPLPILDESNRCQRALMHRVALNAARLTLIHRCFAPAWIDLRMRLGAERVWYERSGSDSTLAEIPWKHLWAVTVEDRLRLRVETEALCALAWDLEAADLAHIVRNDPNEPKGFWRVDRDLPFADRFTGLAARAFESLRRETWSAQSAESMSNSAFFRAISASSQVAKRAGYREWKPEQFEPGDLRFGWSWRDCERDAAAVQAVARS
jgi:hypothetical protein